MLNDLSCIHCFFVKGVKVFSQVRTLKSLLDCLLHSERSRMNEFVFLLRNKKNVEELFTKYHLTRNCVYMYIADILWM